MLPSSRRVSRTQFDTLLKRSQSVHSSHFSLRYAPLPEDITPSRVSVVVSSQVCKKAHDRNLLKRRIRSAVESQLKTVKNGSVLVFFAKKTARDLDFKGISEEVVLLLRNTPLVVL